MPPKDGVLRSDNHARSWLYRTLMAIELNASPTKASSCDARWLVLFRRCVLPVRIVWTQIRTSEVGHMIHNVEIRNFRTCHGVVLDNLRSLTVLVGHNAVGKSNILHAIQWAADVATAGNVSEFRDASGDVTMRIRAGKLIFEYSVRLTVEVKTAHEPRFEYHLFESLASSDGRSAYQRIFRRENEELTLGLLGMRHTIDQGRTKCTFDSRACRALADRFA